MGSVCSDVFFTFSSESSALNLEERTKLLIELLPLVLDGLLLFAFLHKKCGAILSVFKCLCTKTEYGQMIGFDKHFK